MKTEYCQIASPEASTEYSLPNKKCLVTFFPIIYQFTADYYLSNLQ